MKGCDTFHFIHKHQIPRNKKVTYARFCCDVQPQKEEKNRTQMTAGGDRLKYEGETATETASMETTKILINSTISTEKARFACWDIGNFYTNLRLETPEYMRIHIKDIPEEVIEEYNMLQYVNEDGYVYCEITGAMYGLAQAGQIAHLDLIKNLAPHGYFPSKRTPGLWFHKTKPIAFTLVVDNFGIKYIDKEHINHLLKAVEEQYPVKVDWTGSKHLGMGLQQQNYDSRNERV